MKCNFWKSICLKPLCYENTSYCLPNSHILYVITATIMVFQKIFAALGKSTYLKIHVSYFCFGNSKWYFRVSVLRLRVQIYFLGFSNLLQTECLLSILERSNLSLGKSVHLLFKNWKTLETSFKLDIVYFWECGNE